jgi:hypothetical protein
LAIAQLISLWPRGAFWFCAVAAVASAVIIRGQTLFQRTCPRCGRASVKRLARAPLFHECVDCKARLRRVFGRAEWQDASDPEFDAHYQRRSDAGRWTQYEPPRLDQSTLGSLLRNKWIRNRSGPIKPVATSRPAPPDGSLHDPWLDD